MIKVKWFGHAAFQVSIDSKTFYVDPWMSNPLSPVKGLPEAEPDYIIVTHDHGDHLGEAIEMLKKFSKAKFIGIYELASYVAEVLQDHTRVIGANIGGPIDLGEGYKAILTPAFHSSGRGAPTGVVFGKPGKFVYHAGDTGLHYEMKLIGDLYKPTVALLPIGGHFTMGPEEAAYATSLIRPKYVIPMHYGTFPVIKGTPEEFKEHLRKLNVEVNVIVLKAGEEYVITD